MRRLLPYAAALAVAASAPVAAAAPCRSLITDRAGDAVGTPPQAAAVPGGTGVAADPALDVVRADLVSGARVITAVVRVTNLGEPSPETSVGRIWRVHFTIPTNRQRYWLEAVQAVNGVDAYVGRHNLPSEAYQPDRAGGLFARAVATLNPDAGEIRITADLRVFEEFTPIRPRTVLYDLAATTAKHYGWAGSEQRPVDALYVGMGSTGWDHPSDEATTARTYRAGSPGCVRP